MLFTHGRWLVNPGQEPAFIAAWKELAAGSGSAFPDGPWAVLLRDRDNPRQFFSFGPWASLEGIAAFRASPEFSAFQQQAGPALESVEVFVLDLAAQGGEAPFDGLRSAE
jgi:quinol monooxygenase YgiN